MRHAAQVSRRPGRMAPWAALLAVLAIVLAGPQGRAATEAEAPATKASRTAKPPVQTESSTEIQTLKKKLDEVLANQQTILQKLEAMTEELHIIKIRATR